MRETCAAPKFASRGESNVRGERPVRGEAEPVALNGELFPHDAKQIYYTKELQLATFYFYASSTDGAVDSP